MQTMGVGSSNKKHMQSMEEKKGPVLRVWSFETVVFQVGGLFQMILFSVVFFRFILNTTPLGLFSSGLYLASLAVPFFLLKNACILDFYHDHVLLWSLVRRKRIAYLDVSEIVFFNTKNAGNLDFYYQRGKGFVKCNVIVGLSDRNVSALDTILKTTGLKKVRGPSSKYRRRLFGWERNR
jgi:hypothetical protein